MKHLMHLFILLSVVSCTQRYYPNAGLKDMHASYPITKAINLIQDDDTKTVFDTLSNGLILEIRNGVFYIDDMMFNDSTVVLLSQLSMDKDNNTRTGVTNNPLWYWKGRVVHYAFDSSASTILRTNAIDVMNELSLCTGISFVERTPNSGVSNYILFVQHPSMNNSYVGMIGGAQVINICSYGYKYVILHEIFHALGCFHEHQRSDRDNYISLMTSNIKPDKLYNFEIIPSTDGYNVGSFNFESIMLYGSYTSDTSFVYNVFMPMMLKLNGASFYQNLSYLSTGDINSIRAIYGPPFHRLEENVSVYADYVSGNTEMYDAYHETFIKFYEDEACTIRSSTLVPRKLSIHYNETSNTSGNLIHNEGNTTITVPAGVDSVFIDSRRNIEYYLNGNIVDIDTKYYTINNAHVPSVTINP